MAKSKIIETANLKSLLHLKVRIFFFQYGTLNGKSPLGAEDIEVATFFGIRHCLRSLTMEPVMFLYSLAYFMNFSCLSNMMMTKGCLYHFNYSESICHNLSGYPSEKEDVEILANNYSMYVSLIDLIAAVMMVLIAPWSDQYGRKLPLFLAIMGTILSDVGLGLCAFCFESELFFIVLARLPSEVFGGFICVLAIIYSHASDVTSEEERTMKYSFVQISLSLGMALGGFCGALIYHYSGYFYIHVTAFVLHVMCLPWFIVVEETTGLDSTATWKEKMGDFFVCENLLKGWKTSIRVRDRTLLLMYFASMCALLLTYESLSSFGYIYVHHIYNWDPITYNTINTVFSLSSMVVLAFAILLLVRIVNVSDFALGIIGVVSMMSRYTFFAFAHYGVYMYHTGNVLGYLSGFVPLAIRSSVSKIADRDEIGKVFSFLATCEYVVPMLGTVAITKVFNATMDIYPNVSYLITGGLLIIPFGTFLWGFICSIDQNRNQEESVSVH